MNANDRQVGGQHYRSKIQHWDYVLANDLDYFQAQITKYVTRWKNKNGLQDLEKAQHFLEKYIEEMRVRLDAEEVKKTFTNPFIEFEPTVDALAKSRTDFMSCSEPQSQGYVNQDGPNAR